jgi:type I restriction enzyme, S subunit
MGSQFSNIENFESEIDSALERTETLRQSILKKAFSGKLVAQNPDDEPAHMLLERIQAEKTSFTSLKKQVNMKRKEVA